MSKLGIWIGQGLLYAALALTIGTFSRWPIYQNLAADRALIRISISHQGRLLGDCVTQSPEELARLPPNMRAPQRCPRERSPLTIEVDVDGVAAYRQVAGSSGLSSDGPAVVYRRLEIPAGVHRIEVRMKDDARSDGFNYTFARNVSLQPTEILVIDFDSAKRRIIFR